MLFRSMNKLTNAEIVIADLEAAKAVTDQINAIPEKVTLNDKVTVEDARAAYDALTDDQKALLTDETLSKLTAAEESIADQEAVKEYTDMVNALPAATAVTLNDKEAIEAARAAFDALTDKQKDMAPLNAKVKLALDEFALAQAVKAAEDEAAGDAVEEMIRALPSVADISINDKAAVEEARAAYDALTDDQKKYVSLNDRINLIIAETAIQQIENDIAAAEAVKEMINALPAADAITMDDAAAVEQARAAYDSLTANQKALVDKETVKKLTDAEDALVKLAEVQLVENTLNALPDAEAVTLNDAPAIEAARAAYENLSDEQKAMVSEEAVQKLTDAEEALAQAVADKEAAGAVDAMIQALPSPLRVTVNDKEAIEAARAAFDELTDAQKDQVSLMSKVKLALDETALDLAERIADNLAAQAVKDMIDALPAADEITADDKAAVEEARAAYDALTDAQKALIDEDTLKKLTDAEESLQPSVLLGDANGDGVVDISDVTAIQMHIAEIDTLDELHQLAADVNGDGVVAIDDASILQLFLAEEAVDYPIGEMI